MIRKAIKPPAACRRWHWVMHFGVHFHQVPEHAQRGSEWTCAAQRGSAARSGAAAPGAQPWRLGASARTYANCRRRRRRRKEGATSCSFLEHFLKDKSLATRGDSKQRVTCLLRRDGLFDITRTPWYSAGSSFLIRRQQSEVGHALHPRYCLSIFMGWNFCSKGNRSITTQ